MLAGIDVGSTGLKVSLFAESGTRIAYAYREYSLEYLGNGQVMIDPAIWWDSLVSCFKELSSKSDLQSLKALGISHANAIILTDENMNPLWKAIMQLDKRGAEMVPLIDKELGNDKIFTITGNNNKDGYIWGPTLKWLAVHEPETYGKIRYLFNPSSYLVMKLCHSYCMDHTRAATTMLYDIQQGRWDESLCDYFGLSMSNMPALATSSTVVGYTGSDMAELGLPTGVAIVAGGMDTMAAMVGLASGRAENALIMGSVGRFVLVPQHLDRRFLNTVLPDRSALASMTPVNNAGTAMRWARNLLFCRRGAEESCYDTMDRLAAEKAPGANGLVFLPYLNGSSCPNWDSSVRGTFLNIEAFHDTGDFCRAVLEGVGFTLGESFSLLENEVGIGDGVLYCGGGGAKSAVWMQIMADILNRELLIPENLETETIGCAILAGQGAKVLSDTDLAGWNRVVRAVKPREECREMYAERQKQFIECLTLVRQSAKIFDGK